MSTTLFPRPERTVIGGDLEIPRMVSGLWQLAGGHDPGVDIAAAANAMDPLWAIRRSCTDQDSYANSHISISAGLDAFDMADHYGDAGELSMVF